MFYDQKSLMALRKKIFAHQCARDNFYSYTTDCFSGETEKHTREMANQEAERKLRRDEFEHRAKMEAERLRIDQQKMEDGKAEKERLHTLKEQELKLLAAKQEAELDERREFMKLISSLVKK